MNILHYSLGIPPYRSGGLTKYSIDLACEQAKGNTVYLMFPGRMKIFSKQMNINYYKDYKNIKVFEVINPQNVSLLTGIYSVKNYVKKANINIFIEFLIKNKIEIIHLHTLMGLYVELLEAAKQLNIKICYTTHDYFGLAPNPNFFDCENKVNLDRSNNGFNNCNINPASNWKIFILQSRIYRELKMLGIVAKLKKYINKTNKTNKTNNEDNYIKEFTCEEYLALKSYYDNIFSKIDKFLFNSMQSKDIFERFIDIKKKNVVLNITHSDIKDERVKKVYDKEILTGAYLGPYKDYKGFYDLVNNIKKRNRIKFEFYGDETSLSDTEIMSFKGVYKYTDLKNIFKEIDFVIVPSRCLETFGFVVLEALAHGVPVLSSNTVGSKDILFEKGIVYNNLNDVLSDVDLLRKKLCECNENIIKSDFINIMSKHSYNVIKEYKILLK